MHGETHEVRPDAQQDWPALEAHLRWHLSEGQFPGLRLDAGMQVAQFAGGHTHLTYLVRFGGADFVLRCAPREALAWHTHDVAREYRCLAAIHPVFEIAPRPLLLCDDPSIIGSAFSLMERRRGIVVRDEEPLTLAGHPDARRQLSAAMLDTLVALHALDITRGLLPSLGSPVGFLDAQVREWTTRWQRARIDPVPDMDALVLWLETHQPPESLDPCVVHGTFRVDKLLLNPLNPAEVLAVLDWEDTALGDPLVDLGIMLAHWSSTAGADGGDAWPVVTAQPGYLTRDELISGYADRTGLDVSAVDFYEAFGVFRMAVEAQQHHARQLAAQTPDSRREGTRQRIVDLARRARRLAG